MFKVPSAKEFFDPMDEIDVNEPYIVQLQDLTDEGVSNFWKPKPGQEDEEPDHMLKWVFTIHRYDDGTPILNMDGDPHEMWQFTSNKTGKGKRVATARMFMEALAGRPLEDSEIPAVTPARLINRKARAFFHEVEGTDKEGQKVLRKKIQTLSPYKPKGQAAAPAPAPEPKKMPQLVAVGAAAAGADEEF